MFVSIFFYFLNFDSIYTFGTSLVTCHLAIVWVLVVVWILASWMNWVDWVDEFVSIFFYFLNFYSICSSDSLSHSLPLSVLALCHLLVHFHFLLLRFPFSLFFHLLFHVSFFFFHTYHVFYQKFCYDATELSLPTLYL